MKTKELKRKKRKNLVTAGLAVMIGTTLIPVTQVLADTVPTADLPTISTKSSSPNAELNLVPGARTGAVQGVKVGTLTSTVSINTAYAGNDNNGEVHIGAGQAISPTGKVYEVVGSGGSGGDAEVSTHWETNTNVFGDRHFIMFIGSNPGRFEIEHGGYQNNKFVAARWWKDKWYYDNNGEMIPFTPNASDFVVGFIRRNGTASAGIDSYTDFRIYSHEIQKDGVRFYRGVLPVVDDPNAKDLSAPSVPGAVTATAEGSGIRFDFGAPGDTGDKYVYRATTNYIIDNYNENALTQIKGFNVSAGTSNLKVINNYAYDKENFGGIGLDTNSGTIATIKNSSGTVSYTYEPKGAWYADEVLTSMHGDAKANACHLMFAPDGDAVTRMPMASENRNFRVVCYTTSGWRYDDNAGNLKAFTKKSNDVLIAEVFRYKSTSAGIDWLRWINSSYTNYSHAPLNVGTDPRSWTPNLTVTVPASGTNGYSYAFNNTTGMTAPNNTVNGSTNSFLVNPSGGLKPEQYFAVKAKDAAGNWSGVREFILKAPQVSVSPGTTGFTNQNVPVTVTSTSGTYAINNVTRNGVSIATTAGTKVDSISENGTYVYEVTDTNGFTWSETVTINNIDKTAPTGDLTASPTSPTNQDVTLSLTNASDTGGSGYSGMVLPGGITTSGNGATYIATRNGTYTFKLLDNAGNETLKTIVVDNIDKTAPTASLIQTPPGATNGDVTLALTQVADSGGAGLKNIRLPDGTFVTGTSATFKVSANGTYSFTVYDNAGNSTVETITVSNIDKIDPTATLSQTPTTATNGDVTLNLTAIADTGGSGYYRTKLPNGTYVTTTTASQAVSANGTYSFTVYDKAGNETVKSITVSNIDKTAPTGTLAQTPTTATNGDVTLNLTAIADTGGSGYYRTKLPSGTFTTATATSYIVTANGTYTFEIYDKAGNSTEKTIEVTNIDKEAPTGTLSQTPTSWTDGAVTLNLTAIADTGSAGYYRTKLPSGAFTTATTASYAVTANGTYSFVIYDKAGNETTKSITVSNIDKAAPTANLTQTPTAWTDGDVTLNLTGVADTGGSALKNITLPNGTVVTGTSATQTVSANGTYSFVVEDNAGNTLTKSITVTNIDKTLPNGTLTQTPTAWTNGNVTLNLAGVTDTGGSGLKHIVLPNGTIVTGTSASQVVSANGTYAFKIVDNAGNEKSVSISVTNIEKSAPTANLAASTTAWTNSNVTLTLSAVADTGGSGLKSVTLPNGTVVSPVSATSYTHAVTANGTYSFELVDNAGNSTTKTITVANIDKTAPAGTATASTTAPTNADVTLTLSGVADSGGSGLKSLTLPDGTVVSPVSATSYTHVVTANGTYSFTLTDNAGSVTTRTVTVNNIDKTAPVGTLSASSTVWTNEDITLTLSGVSDSGTSGLKNIKLPNGTFVTGTSATYVVTANGTYTFEIYDNAGNKTVKSIAVSKIDKTLPVLNLVYNNSTNVITATVSDAGGSGLKEITLPNGTKVTGTTATFTPETFGNYSFTVTDNAGNSTTKSLEVDRLISIPDDALRQAIIDKISAQFGIKATASDIKERRLSQLTGTFAPEGKGIVNLEGMQYLTNVTNLSLKGNPVVNVTPIKDLKQMTELDLSSTSVTDISSLNGLTNLVSLKVGSTELSLLTGIEGMTNLRDLNVDNTKVSDLTPVRALTKIESLSADYAAITTLVPLQGNNSLTFLSVSGNQLVNLNGLSAMTKLTELHAGENLLTSISAIKTLTSLQIVDLNRNKLSAITDLTNLVNITYLDVSVNTIATLTPVNNMSKISFLSIDSNRIVSLEPLQNKTLLTSLYAYDNRIWDLTPLANKNLSFFDISSNIVGKLPANLAGFPDWVYYNNFIEGKPSQNKMSVIVDKSMEEDALLRVNVGYTMIESTWTGKMTPTVTFEGNNGLTAEAIRYNRFDLRSSSPSFGKGTVTFALNPDVQQTFEVNVLPVMPAVIVTPATNVAWTNGTVTLNVEASTRVTDVKRIFLPNGSNVAGSSAQYVVSDNGIYGFAVLDGYGRLSYTYYVVNNIDKKTPSISVAVPSEWTNTDATIKVDVIND